MKTHFAEKLQELRKSRGLSQEQLAEILEVSRQSVSRWESGQVYPEIDKIIFLSHYFNVSTDELLKENPQPQRKTINLSKSDSIPYKSIQVENDEDIMPQGYNNVNPPVQPYMSSNNMYIPRDDSQKKNKKKRKMGKPLVFAIVTAGALLISSVITAIVLVNDMAYTEDIIYENETEIFTGMDGLSEGMMPYERTVYYYDKESGQYIEVFLPIPLFDSDFYGFDFSDNVYIDDLGGYVGVVTIKESYSDYEVNFYRYFSEEQGCYFPVLVPSNISEVDIECYGYDVVDVYDNDGLIQKTIIPDEY